MNALSIPDRIHGVPSRAAAFFVKLGWAISKAYRNVF